jgi:TolB-like protein/tetratricopeptide (TPR) repeat protein/predicted Ser/Thr protein kinase
MECSKCQFDNPDATNFCGKCGAPLTADARMADSLTKTLETPLPVIAKDKLIAGKYRIIEEVGHGGMGVVYKAEDLKLKRCVALKFLPPHLMDSPELKERFLIEAQAAAALSHPNICVIHEVGESEERPYIAMEYVEGETLRERVRKGPLEQEEALDIAAQVAAGLGEAHHKGIIHRDIKSANIMVTNKGQAKVMDFGLAKLRGGSSMTKSQTTLGTVAYMSPEQARGEELDGRTDLWSLGVVLYEMISGELPFKGDHDQTVIHSILHREPKPPSKVKAGPSSGLDDIVLRALAKKRADRYQTMEEFREDLEAVAEGLKPLKTRRARRIFGIRTAYVYAALVAMLGLLFGLDVGGLRGRLLGKAGVGVPAIRLAVLPFENLSGDPEQEYFSDGMTGEMITQLGRLHPESLSVIARTSVMRYKKTNTPIDQIGRELDIGYVLEGSVQREGPRVRIRAELIKVKDQSQLWADSMEREMSGVLALQSEVSQKVAGALALKLLPGEQARLANAPTVNPEAYEAYLKGSYQWMKFVTPGDLDTAEKYFDLALEKDPNYAAAYGGIASVWLVRNQLGWCPPEEAGPKAKAAALRAIELDKNSAAAHEALASVRWTDWDWDGARESYRRSLELNPNVATTQAMYAHFLLIMGHGEEGLIHSERAVVLDPFNPLIRSFYALALYSRRRYEEAIAVAREALRLQADFPIAVNVLLLAMHELTGMEKEAFEAAKAFARVTYNDPKIEAALDEGYAQGGYAEAMRRGAETLIGRLPRTFCLPSDIAMFYNMAGEKNMALDWLEKGLEIHDPALPYLGMPDYDSLRPDPRFQDLMRRMKLPVGDKK